MPGIDVFKQMFKDMFGPVDCLVDIMNATRHWPEDKVREIREALKREATHRADRQFAAAEVPGFNFVFFMISWPHDGVRSLTVIRSLILGWSCSSADGGRARRAMLR